MVCSTCATERDFADGRCTTCGAAESAPAPPSVRCPKCRTGVEKGEKFCASCGAKIPTRADRIRAAGRSRDRQETAQSVNRGRHSMLIVAVLTLFGAIFSYLAGISDVEKQFREAEIAFRGMTPAERDARLKEELGMTWDEVVEHDRGMVVFQAMVLGTLGVIYFGLYWWAQTNPFAAALIALLLFITSMLVNALVDPSSLVKGFIVKGFVIAALFSAVSAGYRQRTQRPPRRRLT